MVLVLAFAAFLFLSCTETPNDNPFDPNGTNYIGDFSSSSEEIISSSSSGEEANDSSSSGEENSSSSEEDNSSSSEAPSSSSSFTPICSGEEYDTATLVCCNGNTYSITNKRCLDGLNIDTKCGDKWYTATQLNIQYNRCSEDGTTYLTRCGSGSEWYNASREDVTCDTDNNTLKYVCGFDVYDPSTQFCNTNKIYNKCDESDYDPAEMYCYNNRRVPRCGNREEEFNPNTYWCENNKIYLRNVNDPDTRYYYAVLIGTQTWMTKNISTSCSSSDNDCNCVYADENECKVVGYLYRWSKAESICPQGYHIPTVEDWNKLFRLIDKSTECLNQTWRCNVNALQSVSGWPSLPCTPREDNSIDHCPTHAGTDFYGFNALPNGIDPRVGDSYWSSYWADDEGDYIRIIDWKGDIETSYGDAGLKEFQRLGVRCVMD